MSVTWTPVQRAELLLLAVTGLSMPLQRASGAFRVSRARHSSEPAPLERERGDMDKEHPSLASSFSLSRAR
jgi:hypothetical protein